MKFFTLLALLPAAFSAAVKSPVNEDSASCCSNPQHHSAVVKLVQDVTFAAGSKLSHNMDQLVLSLATDEDKKSMAKAAQKNSKSAVKSHSSMDMTENDDEEAPATSRLQKRYFGRYSPYWGGFGGYWGGYGGYGLGGYGGYGYGYPYGGYGYGWYKKRSLDSVEQDESAHLQKRWGMWGASYPYGYPFYGM